ncbi:MAG: class I SAM-dependent rRNA methyltransferase [Pseudomonadota bacterium]|nr:class I SAM-dependent rRNA methyltransferase [Pseudomonadota bacterium]
MTARLQLKKSESRRLRAGHLWVFSNEVDTKVTPLEQFEPGQDVEVVDEKGKFMGHGYVNPHSLICARLVSRDPKHGLDASLLVHRINVALSLRQRLFADPYYRLVYGESDGLPGLVIDRFGDVVSVQITTAGMERRKDEIIAALEKTLKPTTIILRNDSSIRALEGLPAYVETALGEVPEFLDVIENGCRFQADTLTGQKTGWFYDHRLNRQRASQYAKGMRVLDVFSYLGGWGIPAAVSGAKEVVFVDDSARALELVHHNAALNNVGDKVSTLAGDAFEILRGLRDERQHFDMIILDPPAFIKRRKDAANGLEAYRRINSLAMSLLERDGILVSASCSYHLPREGLHDLLLKSSRHMDRNLVLLEQGHQGPDHPVHPAIQETSYLKSFICRVLPS